MVKQKRISHIVKAFGWKPKQVMADSKRLSVMAVNIGEAERIARRRLKSRGYTRVEVHYVSAKHPRRKKR